MTTFASVGEALAETSNSFIELSSVTSITSTNTSSSAAATAASTVASVFLISSPVLGGGSGNGSTSNDFFNYSSITTTTEVDSDENSWFSSPIVSMYIVMVVSCLFYSTAFILGALGNGLIIYIVCKYTRMRSLCNVFLASLATADFLLVCVCIPVKMVQLVTYTWTLGDLTCRLLHYVQNVSVFCSVLTLTTMSVERYWAILHPVECRTTFSMHHIQKIIIVIWVAALILAAPTFFIFVQIPIGAVEYGFKQPYWYCVKKSRDQAMWMAMDGESAERWELLRRLYELYMFVLILVLPVLIMTFTYCRICTHLWSIISRRTAIRYGHSCHAMNTEVKKAVKTPVKVVATVVSPNGGNVGGGGGGGVVTTTEVVVTTPKSSSSVSSSYASASTTTTASSTTTVCSSSTSASTAQLHQDCRRSMEEDNATVKQVIKMLVAVVVLFVLCWAPLLLMNVLRAFELVDDLNHGWLKHVVPLAYLLAYLNSVINPFIYGFMSKNFRLYFKTVLGQLLSSRLVFWGRRFGRDGSGTEAGVYGSTKSDASNRANGGGNHNRGAHFTF
ncbi:PREDICTED: pyroglutamylated RFamide peptide receptor-like [Rhagoletis zephyria]|uniref:pyroglutamylated RFamide peptide receptor-like n=1 Tax=Rhagoletis zephyria TaxID=28612 RepID=UPI00081148BF|nr:PREDICTED: pyroglutamylated RFamide peptide receptor-like [Rhagoletis zephyria]